MKNRIIVSQWIVLFFIAFQVKTGIGQIELSNENDKKEENKVNEKDGETEVVFLANWSSTSRVLKENDGLFGKPIGVRENESSLSVWSFGIGFRSQIDKHLTWEGGLSYLRNGESYLFEETDTMFQYATTYSYFAIPIKLYYTVGDSYKFFIGGGIVPQLFSRYSQEQKWRTATNEEKSQSISSAKGINTFLLSAVLNAGIQINLGGEWSLFILPEYRVQLNSSFLTTQPYKHYGRALGLNMGLTFQL
jgi:hypothetical protein